MSPPTRPWLNNEEQDLLRDFWRRAGALEPYPRRLESPLSFALPVALVKLPHLTLRAVENWIRARRADFAFTVTDRAICGCMVANRGAGFIFVDGSDPEDEIRFTIAHEIGHFLADVLRPRQKAEATLGAHIREVLDGERPPTAVERIGAAWTGASLGVQVDFLERGGSTLQALATWKVESRADRIGLALLAPPDELQESLDGVAPGRKQEHLIALLRSRYGLPQTPAHRYAEQLLSQSGRTWSIADAWRTAAT